MILLIDNFDSFVFNLARYVEELDFQAQVARTNQISLEDIRLLNPTHIIISPGPCTPDEAGISLEVIKHFHQYIPIFGVCLGHQAIGQAWGGKIVRALRPMHGKSCLIEHSATGIFENITANPLQVARYHSLVIEPATMPDCLQITASSLEGEIMACQHRLYPTFGVQFHPESVLTDQGHVLLANFLKL